ncbi:MAG: ParB/RepB/Spo0J family partition protein [Ruminococcus sp.]|nr:ParB/RepB/Spo0J family partition protein [Ruminococcus sp.]
MAIGGLGTGLDSLFSDNTSEIQIKKTLRLSEIEPNREQPRKNFSDETIAALADSIKEHGVLQPILVRPMPNGSYQIVAGERRWRAARMVGLSEIPVTIRELSDIETMQIAVIENLQRENLDPVEEAMGYNELIEKYGMTQDRVAKMVGKSRSAVANSVRILSLPDEVLGLIQRGELSLGHAKVLLSVSNEKILVETARKASDGGMTVRQLENFVKKFTENNDSKKKNSKSVDNYFVELEVSLKEKLGRKVKVEYGKNKGALILEFYDKDDLKAIADMLYNEE